MTSIECRIDDTHHMLDIKGHTQSRICAGISTLACTLQAVVEADESAKDVSIHLEPGDMHLEFDTDDEFTIASFEFTCLGLMKIWYTYPGQVSIGKNMAKIYGIQDLHGETDENIYANLPL